jgi:uncharacterized protein with von Willebrand factor type A (vWA) domain
VLTNLNCFSQTGTVNKPRKAGKTDTSNVVLTQNVARKVIKDVIKLDGCELEIIEFERKIQLLTHREMTKDSIIQLLTIKDSNNIEIITLKDAQLTISKDLIDELKKEVKKQKRQNLLFKIGSAIGIISTTILIGIWL